MRSVLGDILISAAGTEVVGGKAEQVPKPFDVFMPGDGLLLLRTMR